MYVGDGTLREVNVESEEVKVIHCFKFDRIAEKVVMDEGLYGWMGQEVFLVDNKPIVHIAVVCKMEICVVKQVVV